MHRLNRGCKKKSGPMPEMPMGDMSWGPNIMGDVSWGAQPVDMPWGPNTMGNVSWGAQPVDMPYNTAQPMGGMPWGGAQPMCDMPWGSHSMGGMPMGGHHHGTVHQVVEPTVHCPPNEFHHHQRIEHIIPVAIKNIHHCHTHHDYMICKEPEKNVVCHHEHGLQCGKDVCELVQQFHQ